MCTRSINQNSINAGVSTGPSAAVRLDRAPLVPSVYVVCQAALDEGTLHGAWIPCNQAVEDIHEEIDRMLGESPASGASGWAILDHAGFSPVVIGEHQDLEAVAELTDLISEQGDITRELVARIGGIDHVAEARRLLEECYLGAWRNTIEWAEDHLEASGELEKIPEHLRGYFDFELYAHNAELSGDIIVIDADGLTHVFGIHPPKLPALR